MAKKSRARKQLKSKTKDKIENIVIALYDHGVWQSTIFHTIVLLILALTFNSVVKDKRILPITISFTSASDSIDFDESEPISISISPEQSEDQRDSIDKTLVMEAEEKIEIDPLKETNYQDVSNKEEHNSYSEVTKSDLMKKIDQSEPSIIDDFPSEFESTITKPEYKPEVVETKPTKKPLPNKRQNNSSRRTATNTQQPQKSVFGYGSLLAGSSNTTEDTGTKQGESIGAGDNDAALNEINRRLVKYGAKTGDVQIALSWNTIDDLDLHVLVNPLGSNINWTTRWGTCGGMLDIDMNAHPNFLNNQPIENIFWPAGRAPIGGAEYVVGVHLFRSWTGAQQVNAILAIKVDGDVKTFPVLVQMGNRVIPVTKFKR